MSYPGSPAPGMVGGIAVDSTALTAFDALEKVQLLFDKNTGALLTTAVGNVSGGTQVEGIHVNNTQVSNPLPTGGFANNGDGLTVVGLQAAFNGGNNLGTLLVQTDPDLTSTVAVSGTVATQHLAQPGVTGDKATATAGTATITYAAGAGAVCNFLTSVHQSYSGSATLPSALAPGTLTINDGATAVLAIDITAAGANSFYFDPPIQGTAATAMTVVLTTGGTAVVGKVNARHYQQ